VADAVGEEDAPEDAREEDQRPMKLASVNTGLPREVTCRCRSVTWPSTSNRSTAVSACALDLDGHRQADLSVHGGEHKAVYGYPFVHYDYGKTSCLAET
jgi:MOSC domain-containing protein YiiM